MAGDLPVGGAGYVSWTPCAALQGYVADVAAYDAGSAEVERAMVTLADGMRVGDVARDVGSSSRHLGSLFRAECGVILQAPATPRMWSHTMTDPSNIGVWATLTCHDPEAVHRAAVAAGGTSLMDVQTQDYGGRSATVRDPEGNLWSLGEYRPR